MDDIQTATRSFNGVKVFGSAILRLPPDTASILIAVSRLEKQPKDAFAAARTGAQAVHAYLQKLGLKDFSASRVTLSQEHRYSNGEQLFVGYQARIGYSVFLRELDRVDEVVAGLITAGANELNAVTFQTTRLKDVRADARRQAILAAREKAEVYASAAGISLGHVIGIEDVNPEVLSGRSESHVKRELSTDDPGEQKAIDPGAITVGAAVTVIFAIRQPTSAG